MSQRLVLLSIAMLVALLVGGSMQLGTLWVNQITGNTDTNYVLVEQVRIDNDTMYVDFVNQLGTSGVSIEQTNFLQGNVHIPVNLTVDQTGTVSGVLNANGGIYADDAINGGYSFSVQDNTGITTIEGVLNPNGGINVDQGLFTVSTTGETVISTAPLRPNGGIDSNYGQFTVSPVDGSVLTQGQLNVQQDVVLGTSTEEDRYVRRVPTTAATGGNTIIKGQDGIVIGGNVVLLPGYASIGTNHGQVVFGRSSPDNLLITRSATSAAVGGQTQFFGQSSTTGQGGDLYLRAGAATNAAGTGGNLWLIPGYSLQGGVNGDIVLGGSNDASQPEFDLTVRRPDAPVLNAGTTTIAGQNALNGNGGDLVLAAGNGAGGGIQGVTGPFGGDVVLLPGVATNTYGNIVLGRNDNDELYVTRAPSISDAGATYFKGQDSSLGQGGDVRIIAGNAATDPAANTATAPAQNGGDIHLVTGLAANNGAPGVVYWGVMTQPLEVRRETSPALTQGVSTTIFGQNSLIARGGDLNLLSGTGPTGSGNLVVQVPSVANARAGTITITAGDTDAVNGIGGAVSILAGNGLENTGGVVSLAAGTGATGGNIILQAGSGNTAAGQVIVKSGAALFLVDQSPAFIDNGDLVLTRSAAEVVRLSANPNAILTVNGQVVLKQRITNTINGVGSTLTLAPPLDTVTTDIYLQDLQHSLDSVIRALSPCGHGLFNVYDPNTNTIVSDSNAAFCTTTINKRRSLNVVSAQGFDPLASTNRARVACGVNSLGLEANLNPTQTMGRGSNVATASTAGPGEDYPPISFLLPADPFKQKCLLYNDAVSGPEVSPTALDTVTNSVGVLAAGFVDDVPTDATKQ